MPVTIVQQGGVKLNGR